MPLYSVWAEPANSQVQLNGHHLTLEPQLLQLAREMILRLPSECAGALCEPVTTSDRRLELRLELRGAGLERVPGVGGLGSLDRRFGPAHAGFELHDGAFGIFQLIEDRVVHRLGGVAARHAQLAVERREHAADGLERCG